MNPNCVGLIGNGVVVHLPSFFAELDALQTQGLDCSDRLFISDRAQLVFDFHQIVDGLKEVELGGLRCVYASCVEEFTLIHSFWGDVALGLQRRESALRTLGRLPGLVSEFTTSLTMDPLRQNSASWLRADINDTASSTMTPKGKFFGTRLIQITPRFALSI